MKQPDLNNGMPFGIVVLTYERALQEEWTPQELRIAERRSWDMIYRCPICSGPVGVFGNPSETRTFLDEHFVKIKGKLSPCVASLADVKVKRLVKKIERVEPPIPAYVADPGPPPGSAARPARPSGRRSERPVPSNPQEQGVA